MIMLRDVHDIGFGISSLNVILVAFVDSGL